MRVFVLMIIDDIHWKFSKLCAGFLLLLHSAIIAFLIYVPLFYSLKSLCIVFVLLSFVYLFLKEVLRQYAHTIVSITFLSAKTCLLTFANQQQKVGYLQGSSTVTAWVSVLNFKVVSQRGLSHAVIFADSLGDKNLYRRLCVYLRF